MSARQINGLTERDALRRERRERRARIDPTDRLAWDDAITDTTMEYIRGRDARAIFAYLDTRGEVSTGRIVRACLEEGRRVVAPVVVEGDDEMTLREVRDPDSDLEIGRWGILAPTERCLTVPADDVALALVPGVAVDARGYRLGYGGGYYDRFLSTHRHLFALGLAFELQRVETCYPQSWDVPLNAVVTERGLTVFTSAP
ncbi:MAG: 5-formyltetrahydrofolate cyclo-ligase [Candidatus Poribacteria bacterium]|nr:5-formyltetrahydrofolate cyclo-ligase [Candidatus Poribacteria bacterium]